MPIQSSMGHKASQRAVLLFPSIALVLAILYIAALHPGTGALGGSFFLFFGSWFIPSAINLLFAAWIAFLFKVGRLPRAAIFIAASFFLGINTLLPALFAARPEVASSTEIFRTVHIRLGETVDAGLMAPRLPGELLYSQAPSALGVGVGWNEGCMCMWWAPPAGPSTKEQVWYVINAYVHRSGIGGPDYIGMGNLALGGVHFDARFTRSAIPNTVNLLLTIYDGLDVTAVYKQSAIPVWSTLPLAPHGEGLSDEHFYHNAIHMLVRQNFWVSLFEERFTGFSSGPLKAFLRRAVIVE